MVQVGIRKTKLDDLEGDVAKLLKLIGYVPSRAKILLKPNIVVASPPEEGDITHPRVIEALVRYFRERKKESCFTPHSMTLLGMNSMCPSLTWSR
jgi:uncharacterized protein (DUF362 family)